MIHHTLALSGGESATIRPIDKGDAHLLADMHTRVSPASLYQRYFRPYMPTLDELAAICRMGADEGAAYVATVGSSPEIIVGLGYFVIDAAGRPIAAEPAFLVEDRFQGQGVGRALFRQLTQHALSWGVDAFDAYVHPTNDSMMRVFRNGGFPLHERLAYGAREVHIDLATQLPRITLLNTN